MRFKVEYLICFLIMIVCFIDILESVFNSKKDYKIPKKNDDNNIKYQ